MNWLFEGFIIFKNSPNLAVASVVVEIFVYYDFGR